ncbi:hypothetical protein OIU76_026889 [Salix suchowensis]|nr:hypothetical protein OIU76_026889 [Salix suchowensis]
MNLCIRNCSIDDPNPNPNQELGATYLQNQQTYIPSETTLTQPRPATNPSSALGLLLRSSKLKEMMEMAAVADCPPTPSPGLDLTPCSFLEDVQTYFDRHDSSGNGDQADDMIFGDLISSYVPPMFQCDFET